MNRVAAAILTLVLGVFGTAVALGATGGHGGGGANAAITQYEPAPPVVNYLSAPNTGPSTSSEKRLKTHKKKAHREDDGKGTKGSKGKKGAKGHRGGQGTKGIEGVGGESGSGGPGSGSGSEGDSQFASLPIATASTGPSGGADGLPFTGFDALLLLGIGLMLVVAGLVQRRFFTGSRSTPR